MKTENSLTKN